MPQDDRSPLLPYFASIEEHRDRLEIVYQGEHLLSDGLALRELAESLIGFETAFWMTELLIVEGRVPSRGQFNARPATFCVRSAHPGSLHIEIDWVSATCWFATAAFAPYVHNGAEAARRAVWSRMRALMRSHVDRRRERQDLSGYVQEIQSLVKQSSGNLIDESSVCNYIVQIDSSLEEATRPMRHGVSRVDAKLDEQSPKLVFDYEDRKVLSTPIEIEAESVAEPVEITVQFTRINRKTGKGLVVVGSEQVGSRQEWCEVVDPAIHLANDPYTTAFAQDSPLKVRAIRIVPFGVTITPYWRILGLA